VRTDERPNAVKLSLIIPCFNEEQTLAACVNRVLQIQAYV